VHEDLRGNDTVPFNDLSRALSVELPELLETTERVLRSGWLVQGPEHGHFESELAEFLGLEHALGVATGTDALELAMRAAMPADRSLVVSTANCGGYATTAARRGGYFVRFADVDVETHLLTPETLAPLLSEDVGVVVVTHLYGRAARVRE